jgi:DNA polymerase-3 subunit chi
VEGGRLKLACRVAEKAYLGGQRAALLCPDAAELALLDDLLWTFADGSFVPHERADGGDPASADCPVILTGGAAPAGPVEVLVNLGSELPPIWPGVQRIAEIIDGDEGRRAAGRQRFRHYRTLGIEPQSHHLPSPGPL